MKHDEGLSLIELIVIIAIAGVLVSVVGISITVVSRQKVSNAASDVRGQFQTAQTIAMSKDNCYMQIETNSNDETIFTIYSSNNTILDKVTVSNKINVSLHFSGGSSVTMDSYSIVRIFYNRESGAFDRAYACGDADPSINIGSSIVIPSSIEFSNGSKSVSLRLTELTGKVSY